MKQNYDKILRWRARNPKKRAAQLRVLRFMRYHEMNRGKCACGKDATSSHHENYDAPYEVVFCCYHCHRGFHNGTVDVSKHQVVDVRESMKTISRIKVAESL
jgi:hypothetical protein